MTDISQSDIREIKSQLRSIAETQNSLIHRMNTMEQTINDKIELELRRRMDTNDRTRRESSAWVIGIITFAVMLLFGLIQIGLGIWT